MPSERLPAMKRFIAGARHIVHHRSFYVALGVGALAATVASVTDRSATLSIGSDVFYGVYLLLVWGIDLHGTPADLRKKAASDDEGIIFIVLITFAALCSSLISIFELLNESRKPDVLHLALSLGSAPLSWFFLHTIAASHYAHVYYGDPDGSGPLPEARGLKFPANDHPGPWEFIYFAFVIGMTAQVSDVQIESTAMRKLALAHGLASFFFNTMLIAVAVNVVVAVQSR